MIFIINGMSNISIIVKIYRFFNNFYKYLYYTEILNTSRSPPPPLNKNPQHIWLSIDFRLYLSNHILPKNFMLKMNLKFTIHELSENDIVGTSSYKLKGVEFF